MATSDYNHLENIPEWLLLKGSCDKIFILNIFTRNYALKVLMVTHILHFLPWRHIKEKQIFMDFFK